MRDAGEGQTRSHNGTHAEASSSPSGAETELKRYSALTAEEGRRGEVENRTKPAKGQKTSTFAARGEPFLWAFGGALALGIMMIVGFVVLILWNGITTFYPRPIYVLTLDDGSHLAGEIFRSESFRPEQRAPESLGKDGKAVGENDRHLAHRTLYRIGNYDLYNEDFRWVLDSDVKETTAPANMFYVERLEWGPFIGTVKSINVDGKVIDGSKLSLSQLNEALDGAARRRSHVRRIERRDIGTVNYSMEEARLAVRKAEIRYGKGAKQYEEAERTHESRSRELKAEYGKLEREARELKSLDSKFTITLADVNGREKTIKLSEVVRMYPANSLTVFQKLRIYFSRWWEFFSEEPREANTEGGVMPAIFGTCVMTIFMALAVAPFGVVAALYLREYARQGTLVSAVRICVNNLAGVPSIVYGVFGLGFFAYMIGAGIDGLFFPERLPNPTFGTGGLLWSSLTLALLTVPVVIVATEEALAAVPQSMREGSLACGASKWQTVKYIVLPRAMPGIMTGLILAMARGAGEVAPLMLVGVVKLAPELPVDHLFPYIHFERSFMHLGFHIYDVGFQSRNAEAAKPMVFVTTLVLISLVAALNAVAIFVRNRLRRKFSTGHF